MEMAQKRKAEEKNINTIKELAHLPENKKCCECGQIGPTYVDLTVLSFCCTSCSGLLRGLNPPHRVKSINMSTFSNEEVEKLRSGGNEENHKTWMKSYTGPKMSSLKKSDVQDYLIKKYEKKSWYASPSATAASTPRTILKTDGKAAVNSHFDLLSGFSTISEPYPSDAFTSRSDDRAFSPPNFSAPAPPPPMAPPNYLTLSARSQDFPQHAKTTDFSSNLFDDFDEKFSQFNVNGGSNAFGDKIPRSTTMPALPPPVLPQMASRGPPPQPARPHPQQLLQQQQLFQQQQYGNRIPGSLSLGNGLTGLSSQGFGAPSSFSQAQPTINEQINPFNTPAPMASTQATSSRSETDKYSALAELDKIFHTDPKPTTDTNNAWMTAAHSEVSDMRNSKTFDQGFPHSATLQNITAFQSSGFLNSKPVNGQQFSSNNYQLNHTNNIPNSTSWNPFI
ncbi:unnamed protein product [Caenorhabditis auriculariae]|uniref:Arf-GAP domain-containing protein n=1 Tax=Caenorhabditis auriculariae TaxID=2777116 RepID=A0A8S1H5A1_9PELO|nr:unnamed protein product [Caenorhabditis auriculariae]